MASEFYLAYQELVRLADDDPVDLWRRAEKSDELRLACERVSAAHWSILTDEHWSEHRYGSNIPKNEIEARRTFERRWRLAVAQTDKVAGFMLRRGAQPGRPNEQQRLRDAVEDGEYRASKFEGLIDYGRERANPPEEWDEPQEWAYEAVAVWDEFRLRSGFDLPSILARMGMVPFTLIPSDISNSHGSAESFSLFTRLGDAQRAFIFGCYLACAALQRAILEDVLHRHYRAPGTNLAERIRSARLPWGLKPSDLRRIKDLGNDVLHSDRSNKIGKMELLQRLIEGLEVLRVLIEKAPPAGSGGQR